MPDSTHEQWEEAEGAAVVTGELVVLPSLADLDPTQHEPQV